MQIAYINRGKASKQSETDKRLDAFKDRDIRLFCRKYKHQIESLNISEVEFIERLKKRLNKKG